MKKYFDQLEADDKRLFCEEDDSAVDFWQFQEDSKEFQHDCAHSVQGIKVLLHIVSRQDRKDPLCRFIFIHADHSRAPLNTSREMLVSALSYHQVMPAFLDFLFPFGRQEYPQDFHFSGFRHRSHLREVDRGLQIPELGRSGKDLQLCYSLKSVESSKSQEEWPWSIRQTAIYHSFDFESGRTVWIIVKGNRLMRNRIKQATGPNKRSCLFDTPSRAFSAALSAHLVYCDWSAENWRWYINFLEEQLQTSTRHMLRTSVDRPPSPPSAPEMPKRVNTMPLVKRQWTNLSSDIKAPLDKIRRAVTFKQQEKTLPSLEKPQTTSANTPHRRIDQQNFQFSDLQNTQHIEEKANETLLILRMNKKILTELKEYYYSIFGSQHRPEYLKADCEGDISSFKDRVASVINDLQMQESRLEALLQLLADRKALLYGILNYQNVLANKYLGEKSRVSAGKMENMTRQMHKIAVKTEKETVSMRIITLVTLFFPTGNIHINTYEYRYCEIFFWPKDLLFGSNKDLHWYNVTLYVFHLPLSILILSLREAHGKFGMVRI